MKVILLTDVKGQGKKDDIIEVSDGYANNYLIKNKLAVKSSKTSNERLQDELDKREQNEQKLIQELNIIKDKLNKEMLIFNVKAGKEDKVFGSISSKQIAEALKEKGYQIDKKLICLNDSIDVLGVHNVTIKLHKKVSASIKIDLKK